MKNYTMLNTIKAIEPIVLTQYIAIIKTCTDRIKDSQFFLFPKTSIILSIDT